MRLHPSLTAMPLLVALALCLPGKLAAQNPDSPEVSRLLQQVKSHVAFADDAAHTLDSFTRSNMHWRSHAIQLERIKEHVNDLIRDGNQMIAMRAEGSPWQQDVIDRISGLLPEMAAHLTATIQHLKENQNQTRMMPYRDMVIANRKMVHSAHQVIANYVDYSEAKAKAEALEKELRVPNASQTGF